ncbi:MAG TPA: UDP-N-acetylglucosamine 2-epimerase (non-hydrolyzing) [Anaerolineales bacterium]|nr:UDP-N-acetylglucosamine 2-epimerase (non-hydrolyzing) [Anaerolineales bacterium]
MRILHIVGARPNFMKVAPIMREMFRYPKDFHQMVVHTGQHYAPQMSQVFFQELDLPQPDVNLNVGSGTHAWQTAQIMMHFEPVLVDYQPDWVVVYGDVNSTLACSLVSTKLGFPVAHVEAGLRSFDRSMPEEVNRIITDQLSDLLFTPSEDADRNLKAEGIAGNKVHLVGNVMIDTLVHLLPKSQANWYQLLKLYPHERYILVTLHRPVNVDDPVTLAEIMSALETISEQVPVLFPVHPRTKDRLHEYGLQPKNPRLSILEPLGYLDFLALQEHAVLVLTDSGGIQEETTYLGVPCLTVRANTERPVTISMGTNQLVDSEKLSLVKAMQDRLADSRKNKRMPLLWDGHTAARIVKVFRQV